MKPWLARRRPLRARVFFCCTSSGFGGSLGLGAAMSCSASVHIGQSYDPALPMMIKTERPSVLCLPLYLHCVLLQELHEDHTDGQGDQHPVPDIPIQYEVLADHDGR